MVFWLYGRSGAGKSTLAAKLRAGLLSRKLPTILLDGDELRSGLCGDLGFDESARDENHRRAAEMARLISRQDIVVIAATMAPQHGQRDIVANCVGAALHWIYVDASYEVCAKRDPKGLYQRAADGELDLFKDFPFDSVRNREVDLHLRTDYATIDDSFRQLLEFALRELNADSI